MPAALMRRGARSFSHKSRLVSVRDLPDSADAWVLEEAQRGALVPPAPSPCPPLPVSPPPVAETAAVMVQQPEDLQYIITSPSVQVRGLAGAGPDDLVSPPIPLSPFPLSTLQRAIQSNAAARRRRRAPRDPRCVLSAGSPRQVLVSDVDEVSPPSPLPY